MAAEIIELGAHERMSVADALGLTAREAPSEVLILFTDADGEFGLRSSEMARKDALWLIELARDTILNGGDEEE